MTEHNQIYNMIFEEDDLKWQSLIYEMIRTGKVNPWDIDVSLFANEYLGMINKLKELNFRISGKVVLTAAILLRMKTNRLGLQEFLGMIEEPEPEELEPGLDDFDQDPNAVEQRIEQLANQIKETQTKKITLDPRLDRMRERKVTIFELMGALKKAMEVDERRDLRRTTALKEKEETRPDFKYEKFDVLGKIKSVYDVLKMFFKKSKHSTVEFTQIIPSKKKEDIIWTFVPLLHLANQGKIELLQDKPFDKIYVELKAKDLINPNNKE
ncbi:segregation/condensation protein A [Candidatus Woesearchaeota archaeon]|jgi:segregation and condensation protein A|nr:segregation/condensation protein A [Candidatus Woesearchaeota archaeon]MBT7062899.1 segregation/condensation protein A [Candidatus Woesearchaeota archaeon]MBT7402249.1 segregation/condensation protein A [Candidatus Woesearchaeota archaeon]